MESLGPPPAPAPPCPHRPFFSSRETAVSYTKLDFRNLSLPNPLQDLLPWKRLLPQPGPQDRRSWEVATGLNYPRLGLDGSAIWDLRKPSLSALSSNPLLGTHWKFIYHPYSCPGSSRVWDPA